MSAAELEEQLAEKRPTLTLLERVQLRRRIDDLKAVAYPPASEAQMHRIGRIVERELPRIIRDN
ncbi:hypothetical protein [Prescottella equi]|uniref:hypothetical protein n=1 Tax=Rhodococcus hoagii TaxID=43767 RepID=UPI000A10DCF4|nr:hypothetical protein [Prescottella equi]ORL35003.1 hypothetical protein A6I91_02005 [Prescottella equi]